MKTSENINELAAALAKFHSQVGKIKKDSKNPFFKSKYASLSAILDVVAAPLCENGLSIVQAPSGDNQLNTMLIHTSGQFISGTFQMMPVKNDPQAQGSAITYARRYALGAFLSLNIDEDDDGNIATQAPSQPWLNKGTEQWGEAVKYIKAGGSIQEIKQKYKLSKTNEQELCQQLTK